MKIKIALCISNFRQGGAETQFWNLVRGLDRNRFDVHVIQIESKGRKAKILELERTKIKLVKARFQLDPISILEIKKYIKLNKIEILQSILFMDNQFARVSGFLAGIPVVTSVRGELLPILGKTKAFIEYQMQRLSTRVVTNSHWLKQELVKGGSQAEKVTVIHNGIKTDGLQCDYDKATVRRKLGLSCDRKIIAIVARLHPMKDHVTFLRTIERLVKGDSNYIGLIIGGGSEEVRLKKMVVDKGLGENIIFAGEVKQDMGLWYRAMDVLLLTSVWGESFPNVIVEAMACNLPVIATDVSAVREIITDGENGFVVEKRSDEQLASRVLRVIDDEQLRGEFIQRGLETVASLDVKYMIENYSKLYQSIL